MGSTISVLQNVCVRILKLSIV